MTKKKATEDQFNELHNLVTKEFLARVKSGEASTHVASDLKAACDWLSKNDISGVAVQGSPLDKLASIMPTVDPELVQRRLYGSKSSYSGAKYANGNYKSYQTKYDGSSALQISKRSALT